MVIDHERLQAAAWADVHTAQKRMDKAGRDLHRHEQIDMPAYDAWLHRTFPALISRFRELYEEVFAKGREVDAVHLAALYTGRSPKALWRERRQTRERPEVAEDPSPDEDRFPDDEADDEPFSARRRSAARSGQSDWGDFEFPSAPPGDPPSSATAREIYRRLVQRLHPDRGGEWTTTRQRLWHELQQAWAAGDEDWLSRLEIEWETAHDLLGPTSPLSRLRRAVAEIHAARRDIERKLRQYRKSPAWRFTLTEKKRAQLHERTAASLRHDVDDLERQLAYLNATIAAWDRSLRRPRRRRPD